jgi:hypothetical protein
MRYGAWGQSKKNYQVLSSAPSSPVPAMVFQGMGAMPIEIRHAGGSRSQLMYYVRR